MHQKSADFPCFLKSFKRSYLNVVGWQEIPVPPAISPFTMSASKTIALPYRLLFLYVEPFFALAAAAYAQFPSQYLSLLSADPSSVAEPTVEVTMSLYQLSNLFFCLSLTEIILLPVTESIQVWKRLMLCFFIADIGHLATAFPGPLGVSVLWKVTQWNAMCWVGIGLVYVLMVARLCLIFGVGLRKKVENFNGIGVNLKGERW
ncbi:hypothetical protein SCHPADRAFT_177925 [Schizopora paradoxa]|uniref:DUF7704 domain-containing protein n=1 Tax=Schizopora paradoxa TaxID=27342 RepID=A0A0H2SJC9_9AGAM|nr:hypothetical protein SCHPADRAFT_177925 [Schizopora paradoxa]